MRNMELYKSLTGFSDVSNKTQETNIKSEKVNRGLTNPIKYRESGGERVFMEKVYRSSK